VVHQVLYPDLLIEVFRKWRAISTIVCRSCRNWIWRRKWGRRYIRQVEMRVQRDNAVSSNGRQPAYTSGYPNASVPRVERVINRLLHVQSFLDGIFQTIEAPAELVFFSVTHSLPMFPLRTLKSLFVSTNHSFNISAVPSFQFSRASILCVTPCLSAGSACASWRSRVLTTFVWLLAAVK
jgi:hypothetical protein